MIRIAHRERVYLLKRGKYYAARYKINGKIHHQSLKVVTRREAMDLARSIEDKLNAGPAFAGAEGTLTYSQLVGRFLEMKGGQGRAKSTMVGYRNHLNNFGRFLGKDLFVDQIIPAHFEDYPAARKREINRNVTRRGNDGVLLRNNHPTNKTLREELISLATLFKWAEKRNYVRVSPARNVELPKLPKLPPRYLTYEQYRALHSAIDDEEFKDIVDFYLLTGMRRGEGILITTTNGIDFERKVLTIPQPKQGNYRQIPIGDELERVIRRLILRADEEGRLIHSHQNTLTTLFHRYAAKAGLPATFTFHVLRHTFGTWLAEKGSTFTEIQTLMGHNDPESTRKYVHAYTPNLALAMSRLTLPPAVDGTSVTKTSQEPVTVCSVCTPEVLKTPNECGMGEV